jgi:hypothetical protein
MVMVIHEAPGVAKPMESLNYKPEQIEEVFSIFIDSEYPVSCIASGGHMIQGTRIFYPERTSHKVSKLNLIFQDLTPFLFSKFHQYLFQYISLIMPNTKLAGSQLLGRSGEAT